MTGTMWAFQQSSINPDIITFGKKTQVCGILANKDKMNMVEHNVFTESSRINSTFGGNLIEYSKKAGDYLLNGLKALEQKFPEEVFAARGKGLMCAFDLKDGETRSWLQSKLYDEGVIILTCGDQSLRFRPHLNVKVEELQIVLDKIEKILTEK